MWQMSVKGVFSAFICGSSGLPARLLKYLSVCFMLPVLFIAGSAAAAEELEAEASDYYFIASFSEPIAINMSAALDPIRMSALWQNEPATGTILCFLQFPDGSPFVRYRRFKAGSKLNYHINYRCWPSASIGFINHFPDENSEACHIISLASMSENISEIGLHFWCEGFRRSRPVIVKILPDHTASPSRVILRLQNVEPILWSFREPSGQPVPSATVSIYEHGHGFIDDLPADASGVVSLPETVGEPFEPVWLTFSAPGFERYRKKLQPEQVLHNQEFILRPDITESDLGKYEQHPVRLIASAAEIQENVEVEFTLLDLYSNLPLASKSLKLTSLSAVDSGLSPDSRFSELVTDENGCVRVRGLLNFWNFFEFMVDGYGRKAFGGGHKFVQPVFLWPGQNFIRHTIRLRPGRKVRIQLNDSERRPKAGYYATIGRIPNRSNYKWVYFSGETDENGWVELDDIAYRGLMVPFPDAHGNKYIDVASIPSDGIIRLFEPPEATVMASGTLCLQLVHPDGRPLVESDLYYSLCTPDGSWQNACLKSSRRLIQLPVGAYKIRFNGEYRSNLLEFVIESGKTITRKLEMVLNRTRTVRFRTLDYAGRPLAGLRLRLISPCWETVNSETDAAGIIDLPIDTILNKSSSNILKFYFYRPETSERQRVNYPVQSLDISDIRGGRNSQNRIETVKIRRGGSVKLKISAGSVGQWLSAVLFSQKSELNPEKRVINFYPKATSGDIEFADLNPGRYWIVVANDRRISENFARPDEIWFPLLETKTLVGWLHERAAVGIAGVEVFSGQTTSVDNIKVEPMAMVSGILPTRSSLITSEKGIEWQTLETDWGISVYSIIKGRLMAVPAGKCRGLMPVFNFPVYIGGICYFQLPAGEYDFYDVLSPTAEPVLLGRYFVAAGEMLQLCEIPER